MTSSSERRALANFGERILFGEDGDFGLAGCAFGDDGADLEAAGRLAGLL